MYDTVQQIEMCPTDLKGHESEKQFFRSCSTMLSLYIFKLISQKHPQFLSVSYY